MKRLITTALFTIVTSIPAFADVGHSGSDSVERPENMIGAPGDVKNVDRTINVTLLENDDGEMLIKSEPLRFKQGETIRFKIKNKGELEHEFVLDTAERNAEHKLEMAKMDMEHDDPNRVRLDAGASGDVIWKFVNSGTFEAACLILGHYESGMYRAITVGEELAQSNEEYSSGTVKKIDTKSGKVTISHGPLNNLEMPAMTMVFRVADDAMLNQLKEGSAIEFVAQRIKGKLTVTTLK
ncbi:copper-binding protein [Tritonibacter mobilis]|uniref:Cupredoxin n=1 Tax=Tritonibacter mobilis F1926 TaxID=1265309 RepID=A0A1B1A5P0_9RHOB|nr:copper-binding protein [Tritonibacter mobilis]ANP41872.1 cupredoxin [Tritonibacter mobilis F1926]EEW58685.1 hypothetical protein SCH4B_3070 [Ruegeria sp. TrichCH4B]KJZ26068.1 cupredoxin [Tritonibacter mobilis]